MLITYSLIFVALVLVYLKIFHVNGRKARLENVNLTGRVITVTGCTAGIGLETAVQCAKLGAHVIMACRDEAKAQQVVKNEFPANSKVSSTSCK